MSILKRLKPIEKTIDIPDIGPITLRQFNAATGLRLAKLSEGADTDTERAAKLYSEVIAASLVGDDGELAVKTDDDRKELSAMSFAVTQAIGKAAMELNGMLADDSKKNEIGNG